MYIGQLLRTQKTATLMNVIERNTGLPVDTELISLIINHIDSNGSLITEGGENTRVRVFSNTLRNERVSANEMALLRARATEIAKRSVLVYATEMFAICSYMIEEGEIVKTGEKYCLEIVIDGTTFWETTGYV